MGKQSKGAKRDKRREKELAREQARREQRKQTMITTGIVAAIAAVGAVLIWVSLAEDAGSGDEFTDEEETDVADDRAVACNAEEPPEAGEDKPTFDAPEQVIESGGAYAAVVETSCGTVRIELDAERAPETVNSFVFLAREGFFDGLEIFRNAPSIAVLQTGAGTNEPTWSVGYTIDDELAAAEEDGYPPGAVAMANRGPDTAGSQFFMVYGEEFDDAFADQRAYARFGMVTEGLDTLEEIGAIDVGGPSGERPEERVYLERVTIEEG